MSIENFLKIYPDTIELKSIIEKEKRDGRSSVATLARDFAMEAGSGLKELLSAKGKDAKVGFALDEKSLEGLPSDRVENINRHHAGVTYGVSIVVLEQSMIEGYFDIAYWCSIYNLAIAGTQLEQMKPEEGKSEEKLSSDHLKAMRNFSSNNKDFSGFFTKKEGLELLPASLKTLFNQAPMLLPIIQKEIIPIFNPRAAYVITPTKAAIAG